MRLFALLVTGDIFEITEIDRKRCLNALRGNNGFARDQSAGSNFAKAHVVAIFDENNIPEGRKIPERPEAEVEEDAPEETDLTPGAPACEHEKIEIRRKDAQSGRIFYYEQCMNPECKRMLKRVSAPETEEQRAAVLPILE